MAFGYGTGVNRQAWAAIPEKWQALDLKASSLKDRTPVRAQLETGFAVMVAKVDGDVLAIGAVCTHAGGPLDEGEFVGGRRRDIKCPWHGSVFSMRSGAALHGPATMDEPVFETRVAGDGVVEVRSRTAAH
jgi:nitrite reductase/ring-hydroxylating ferredoxin subunit